MVLKSTYELNINLETKIIIRYPSYQFLENLTKIKLLKSIDYMYSLLIKKIRISQAVTNTMCRVRYYNKKLNAIFRIWKQKYKVIQKVMLNFDVKNK